MLIVLQWLSHFSFQRMCQKMAELRSHALWVRAICLCISAGSKMDRLFHWACRYVWEIYVVHYSRWFTSFHFIDPDLHFNFLFYPTNKKLHRSWRRRTIFSHCSSSKTSRPDTAGSTHAMRQILQQKWIILLNSLSKVRIYEEFEFMHF